MSIVIGCGEVPWERELLAAAADAGIDVHRRFVDLTAMVREAKAATTSRIAVVSPALRGFEEKALRAVALAGWEVVILVDSIRPPWLANSPWDLHEVRGLDWPSFVAALPLSNRAPVARSGTLTVFVGASGGVGTTTLAALHANREQALLIDANSVAPAVGFLLGSGPSASTLVDALQGTSDLRALAGADRVLVLSATDGEILPSAPFENLMDAAVDAFGSVIVDAGSVGTGIADRLLAIADRIAFVTDASALGIVRACSMVPRMPSVPLSLVVTRVRPSALAGPDAARAICSIVEAETGVVPSLVTNDTAAFDRAWLGGTFTHLPPVDFMFVSRPEDIGDERRAS